MKVFKNLTKSLWALVFILAIADVWGQNTWDGDNPIGNFTYGSNWNPDRSDGVTGTWNSSTDLVFDDISNGSQTSVYFDYEAWKTVKSIYYNSGIPKSFDFNGDGNGFDIHAKIENFSSYAQTLTIPFAAQGSQLELNPINADLSFTNTIYNNNHWVKIYGNNNHNISFSGIITGPGGFTVEQNSNVYFNAAQTFTGGVNITAGSINLGIANAIADANYLNLNGGTFSTNGYTDTLGALILQASSSISLGSGSHTLTFADSSGSSWTGGATLTINGWGTGTEGKIFVGNDTSGLSTSQLNQIQFNGYNVGASLLSNGELVPKDFDTEALAPSTQVASTSFSSLYDTPAEAKNVFTISIVNQGDGNGLTSKITNIRLKPYTTNTADWTDHIQGITVDSGGAITPTDVNITDTYIDISFDPADLNVSDNTSKEVTIGVYLNTSKIVDHSILSFMVDADDHGFVADGSGSQFVTTFSGGDFNSNDFPIEVTATELQFTTQPTNTQVNTSMMPAVKVSATDANGNVDTDYTSSISITSTGTLTGAPVSATAVNGVATYAGLTHTAVGYNLNLTADDGSLPVVTSNPFNIFDEPENCSQLFISEYGHQYTTSSYNYLEIYNPTDTDVSLDNYRISILYNGTGTPSDFTFTSGAAIAPWGVYVVAEDDGNMIGDQQAGIDYSGNDTVYLQWNGGSGTNFTTIDQIGDGTNPGTGWAVAGIANATNEHTLIRKSFVNHPNTNWAVAAGTTTENSHWIVSGYNQKNAFSHESACGYYPCEAVETPLFTLDFETAGGYTPSVAEFNNTATYNYFIRAKESELGTAVELTGMGGEYIFAVQNTLNGKYITLDDIDITDYSNLKMSIKIAEDDASDGNEDWDPDSWMHITYTIDGSTERNIMWVESSGALSNNYEPAYDSDFNGVGNYSFPITDHFETFTHGFTGQGKILSIKIAFNGLDEQTEDIAIDDIVITGDKIPTSTYTGAWDTVPDATRKAIIDDNLTMSTDITACKCQVNAAKTLMVDSNKTLTVVGAIENNGTIGVKNGSSIVQILDHATNTGTGTYQIHKTTTQYADYDYIFWSSPVNNETAGSVFAANNPSYIWKYDTGSFLDLYDGYGHPQSGGFSDTFDDNGDDWVHVTSGAILSPGIGYIAMGDDSDFPLDFANIETNNTDSVTFDGGTINNGEIQVNVVRDLYNETNAGAPGTYSGADTFHTNANLIGNPYPSAIDISLFKMANPLLEGTFYFWMHDTQISSGGGPWAYNFTNDDYSTVAVDASGNVSIAGAGNGSGSSASRYIASGQGFFANVTGDGTLTFNNSMRVTGNNDTFRTPANNNIDKFWLNLSQENSTEIRQIYIGFHDQASDDYQAGQDAQRMENGNNLDFYSIIPGDERHFAIQNLATFNESKIVPLGVEGREAGNYTINMVKGEGIFDNQVIYLFDYKYNLLHELSAMPYSFVINDTELGELENRFELRFVDGTAGVEEEVLNTLIVYPNPSNGQFYFNWQGTETLDVQVFDMHARLVYAKSLNKGDSIDMSHVQSGIYLAKIQVNDQQIVKKLVVR